MSSWKPTRANVGNNRNLLWMWMKNWTCFKQGKSKNLDSVICTIVSNDFPSIVNNTSSSLIAMKPEKNLISELLILNDKHYKVQIFKDVPKFCHSVMFLKNIYLIIFYHVKTHLWMIMMKFKIVMV